MPKNTLLSTHMMKGKWIKIEEIKKIYPENSEDKSLGFEILLTKGRRMGKYYPRNNEYEVQRIIHRTVNELRNRFPEKFWEHEYYKNGVPEELKDH